ncbi:hypothetical protein V1L54_24215 [Streptomyces sp. TRM 70361]|uniref:hypothetical protein n=1 Tax=Streptomyces sp. TRM 70361 TaxID=3116553 RepID=UPI002E7B9539|nr:hypothetical protein [Streptomyces sp. TRM 70361]MEE1942469.1 hypothetical protein [Streptomyces sp. TRM 70361]
MTEREQGRGEGPEPLNEEEAWARIVAAYGEEPADPPPDVLPMTKGPGGEKTGETGETESTADAGDAGDAGEKEPGGDRGDGTEPGDGDRGGDDGAAGDPPVRSLTVYAAGSGPRDWSPAEPSDGTPGEDGEGHFVPPEPPPLPRGDTTSRFAWLAVLGGPLLLVLTVLFQQEVTWWITTLGVGGFLGGFATLVMRMRDDEDDGFDDPGRGAVV